MVVNEGSGKVLHETGMDHLPSDDAENSLELGKKYLYGIDVRQSDVKAAGLFRKASDLGNSVAQWYLGWMYDNGIGVPQSDVDAVKWYRKAADQGLADAQNCLGWMYDNGIGVPQSDVDAVKWYRKAADQGLADAQNCLGWMYDNGIGVPQSDVDAVKWYRKAADQGFALAEYNLGKMYLNGRGVQQSDAEAVKWFKKASDQGYAESTNDPQPSTSHNEPNIRTTAQGSALSQSELKAISDRLAKKMAGHAEVAGMSRRKYRRGPDTNPFAPVFEYMPYDSFVRDPRIILSYMMDFGFSRVHVALFNTVISNDLRNFKDLLSCPDADVSSIVASMAGYCCLNEAVLNGLIVQMRDAMKARGLIKTV